MKLHKFSSSTLNRTIIRKGIEKITEITKDHLTPELKLRLLTRNSPLWTAHPSTCQFRDPFWAFYWAGGQALTRFVLDNPSDFKGKYVLDIGSGCGASAIAAAKCKAKACFANDIDNVSCEAVSINSRLNDCHVHIIQRNIISNEILLNIDYLLVGDMFYDTDFSNNLFNWLKLYKDSGSVVLIGDPGRYALAQKHRANLKLIKEYPLLPHHAAENNGFKNSAVWML